MADVLYGLGGLTLLLLVRSLGQISLMVCRDTDEWQGTRGVVELLIGFLVFTGVGMLAAFLAQGQSWFIAAVAGAPTALTALAAAFLAMRAIARRARTRGERRQRSRRLRTLGSHLQWAGVAVALAAAVFLMGHRPARSMSPALSGDRHGSHVHVVVSSPQLTPGCCVLRVLVGGRSLATRRLDLTGEGKIETSVRVPSSGDVRVELVRYSRGAVPGRVAWLDFR